MFGIVDAENVMIQYYNNALVIRSREVNQYYFKTTKHYSKIIQVLFLCFSRSNPQKQFPINFLFPTTCYNKQLLVCLFCFNYFFSLHEFKVEIDNKEIFEKSPNLVIKKHNFK